MKDIEKNIRLNYQFSIFGDFPNMTYDNAIAIGKLTEIFSVYGFIPTTTRGVSIIPGTINIDNRISLNSSNGWGIMLDRNRIDITIAFDENIKEFYETSDSEIIKTMIKYMDLIIKSFDTHINRFGFNTTDILNSKITKNIIEKYNKTTRIINYYDNKESNEWNERIVIKEDGKKLKEKINVITNISRTKGRFQRLNKYIDFNGIVLQFDINTLPELIDFRFNKEEAKKFLDDAVKFKSDIEGNII